MSLFIFCHYSREIGKHVVDKTDLDVIQSVMTDGFTDFGHVSERKIGAQASSTLYSISIEPQIRKKMTEQGVVEMLFNAINDHKENTRGR